MEKMKKNEEEVEKNSDDIVEQEDNGNINESEAKESIQDSTNPTAKELELEAEVEQLRDEKDKMFDQLARIQAEYDNFKKRTQKEKQASQTYKAQDLVTGLLPVIDNFERALKTETSDETSGFMEGMNMVYRQLLDALHSEGVSEIETVGKEFDPNMHHAVMQAEDENYESNIVVEELQKGYLLKDRVIRPAMVKVNK